jgi:hypothetical protein
MKPKYIEESPTTSNPIFARAVTTALCSIVNQRKSEALAVIGRDKTTIQETTFHPG